MGPNILAGQWKQLEGKAKLAWGKLTDDDLKQIDGKVDVLIGALQKRYGYTKDEARNSVEEWLSRFEVTR